MASDDPGTSLVEQAWDEAALGYDSYFAPRFAPYLGAAIGALVGRSAELPSGPILVPCTGPGHELQPLARAFDRREIHASDLSLTMVKLARQRVATFPNVFVEQSDATRLSVPNGGASAIVSVFGLQLLPNPSQTLGSWLALLNRRGLAVIVYWPRDAEPSGPFHSMRQLLRSAGILDGTWESELHGRILGSGAKLLADSPLAFEIAHESSQTAWSALTHLGPLRGLALARGDAFVAELGQQFVAELPEGKLVHTPEARLLVIERG